jgi:hypothetical protein
MTALAVVAGIFAALAFLAKHYGPKSVIVAVLIPVALIGIYAAKLNYEIYQREQRRLQARIELDALFARDMAKR